jgi:protein-disulfide isomerase
METETKMESSKLSVPMAIIVAGILVAGAIYFSSVKPTDTAQKNQLPETGSASLENIRAISNTDHIRGDINAPIKIVEYSDTECPFCQRFHITMKQIMEEYGKDGKVAWVYRHSPLYKPNAQGQSLHSKAGKEAEALECANELGGNDKFWAYTDRIFEITPMNNGLDPAELPKIAEYVGLDVAKFNSCLSSGKYQKYVDEDLQNAIDTGGGGTPWSIIIAKDGKKYPINGAQPYETVKQNIDSLLK